MKKIIFGITSLGLGGAERVLVDIANNLKDIYDITIFTIYAGGAFEKELDKKIKLISIYNNSYESMSKLNKKLIPLKILTCKKQIYNKYIKDKYDIEIAFLEGAITRIFASKSNSKKIVWIHNDIKQVFGNDYKSKIKNNIDKDIYSKYDKIVFVSNDNKEAFNKLYIKENNKNLLEKEEVCYNYIDRNRIIEKSNENADVSTICTDKTSIITVSRLVKQKAIDRLIKVHKKLIDCGLKHNIYVIGDGPEKEELDKLIKELKVEDTFHLLGAKENPYPFVKKADYFALLSNFEGYPMTLEEAKILNKKILITNTASREVVKNYSKSIIFENNENAIYEGLKQVLEGNIVLNEEEADYDNEKILKQVKKIIEVK